MLFPDPSWGKKGCPAETHQGGAGKSSARINTQRPGEGESSSATHLLRNPSSPLSTGTPVYKTQSLNNRPVHLPSLL